MAARKKFISILAVCAASIAGLSAGSVTAEAPQTFENDYRNSLWDGSGDSFSAKPAVASGAALASGPQIEGYQLRAEVEAERMQLENCMGSLTAGLTASQLSLLCTPSWSAPIEVAVPPANTKENLK